NASLLSESLFVPLVLGVLHATLQYRRDLQLRWALLAGALCGLAALTRVNGMLLVIAAVVGVWAALPVRRRRALVPALAVVAGAACRDLYSRPRDEGVRSSRLTHRALDYAKDHPGYVAGTLFWNTLRVFDIRHDTPFKTGFQGNFLQATGDARLASRLVPATV